MPNVYTCFVSEFVFFIRFILV